MSQNTNKSLKGLHHSVCGYIIMINVIELLITPTDIVCVVYNNRFDISKLQTPSPIYY